MWNNVAGIHWARMLSAESAEASEHAADEYRLAGDRPNEDKQRASALVQRGLGPTPWSDIQRLCETLLADPETGLRLRAEATGMLAVVRATAGRFEEARSLYEERQRAFTELRIPLQVGIGVQIAFTIEQLAGDPGAAEAALRQAIDLLRSIGSHNWADGVVVQLAWCLAAQGRDDEALEAADSAGEGYAYGDTVIAWVRATVLARRGSLAEAVKQAERAVVVADTTDSTELRAESRLVLARILRPAGDPVAGSAAASAAADLYDAKENLVLARVARALVAEL
jgi:tetratricopeptide (TPR) repeat protein